MSVWTNKIFAVYRWIKDYHKWCG